MKGNVLENINTFKDLMVIFDNHFIFDKHIMILVKINKT